ncbi:MAG: hypothetical protein EOO05_02110 [Chitinophagaceae bacterium]|nr:MAG: hypothetical protein EOO05_02110 [Chitinophagaceae bacterium]
MIRFVFLLLCHASLIVSSAAVITWDGEAFNNQWDDPLNWVGDRLPLTDDEVRLDNSVVAGHYDVLLPGADVSVVIFRLHLHPDAGYRIRLILPPSSISLTAFRAMAEGDAVILDDGSEFINESGATSSSTPVAVSSAGRFRINNGARYVHRTARSATENLISNLSAEPGTEKGIFEFDVTVASYIVSLSGRTFGTLVLNAATNHSMVNYRGSGGNPLTIRGDLRINANVTFTLSLSSEAEVQGDLQMEPLSVFNLQSTDNNNVVRVRGHVSVAGILTETGTGIPALELNGTGEQQVAVTGGIINEVRLVINNGTSCRLESPLQVFYSLELVNGRLITNDVNHLLIGAEATCNRVNGMVQGPLTKQRPAGFLYPVGLGGIYAPVGMPAFAGVQATDQLTVEYIRANPHTAVGNIYQQSGPRPIGHISQVEYWKLSAEGDFSIVPVVNVTAESFSRNLAATFVVHFFNGQWINRGASVLSGPVVEGAYETGQLVALDAFAAGGYMTVGTNLPFADNPLPVDIISFDVHRSSDDEALFTWQVSELPAGGETFTVSQPENDSTGSDLFTIHSAGGQTMYNHRAAVLKAGTNRFRLRVTDDLQRISYSRIVSLEYPVDVPFVELGPVFPNPAGRFTNLRVRAREPVSIEFQLHEISGLLVKRIKTRLSSGSTVIPLSLEDLRSGCYFLTGVTVAGQTNTVCLLRE